MVDVGVYVGVEAVLSAVFLVPCGLGLLIQEVEPNDGFSGLEAVLPRQDDADWRSILVGQDLTIAAEGEQSEGVHGLVHAEAFAVRPVVTEGTIGHLLFVVEGKKLDEFGARQRFAEVDELRKGVAVPGDDHRPGLDAAMAVYAAFDGAIAEKVVDVDGDRLLDQAGDLDGPGTNLERVGIVGRLRLVGAELVVVVVGSGFVEGRLRVGNSVFAGYDGKVGGGLDGSIGVSQVLEVTGGYGTCSERSSSGEEAAAVLLVPIEDVLRRDVGGTNG